VIVHEFQRLTVRCTLAGWVIQTLGVISVRVEGSIFPVGVRRAPERSWGQLSEHCLSAWRRRRSRELRSARLREERREPRAFRAASDRGAFLWVLV